MKRRQLTVFLAATTVALSGCAVNSLPRHGPLAALPGIEAVAPHHDAPVSYHDAPVSFSTPSVLGADLSNGLHEFHAGTLTTPDAQFKITGHRLLPVGETGNESGPAPLLLIYLDVSQTGHNNLIAPNDWFMFVTVTQPHPSGVKQTLQPVFQLNSFDRSIAGIPLQPGQSTATYIAYELIDEKTPVELIATDNSSLNEVGRQVVDIK